MRTSSAIAGASMLGLVLGFSPAGSFDSPRAQGTSQVAAPLPPREIGQIGPIGTVAVPTSNVPAGPTLSSVPPTPRAAAPGAAVKPFDALRSGTQMLRDGQIDQGVSALEYAAERGLPSAIWKLGRIYADGDGVARDQKRAFEYFHSLTRAHANDPPGAPHARFVANAFVALGHFYLQGIPNSEVKADAVAAHRIFRHAATFFGDPDAQYQVGRMFLDGTGVSKDPVQAARWLLLAADAGHRNAQALLGSMLFKGKEVSRQAAMGLFWLTVAKDAVKDGATVDDKWIVESHASAFSQATDDERAMALGYLEGWMRARR